jgi:signal transduction histidine kinase
MHGGTIAVCSVLQRGTTLTATFPAARIIARQGARGNGRRGAA